jgi:hypothetical protein
MSQARDGGDRDHGGDDRDVRQVLATQRQMSEKLEMEKELTMMSLKRMLSGRKPDDRYRLRHLKNDGGGERVSICRSNSLHWRVREGQGRRLVEMLIELKKILARETQEQ